MNRVLVVLLALLAVALIAVGISSYRKKHLQPPANTFQSAPSLSPEILKMREQFDKENAQKEQFKTDLTQEIADFNRTLPKDLGDYLTLNKVTLVGKQVTFDYTYSGPPINNSRDSLTTAINAFACSSAASRGIMSNGLSVTHRVTDADGRSVVDTRVDSRYCGH